MTLAIREYVKESGRSPFRDWLDTLDFAVKARIQAHVLRFEIGNLGDHKSIGGGVWEARSSEPDIESISEKTATRSSSFWPVVRSHPSRRISPARRTSGATIWRQRSMARRSRDWNVGLAQDLQSQEFAREFLLAAIEEGVPIQVALAKVVRATGVKEFAVKVGMASPNVLRAIDRRHNPTQQTLNRLLRPFNLRLSLARIEVPRRRHAA